MIIVDNVLIQREKNDNPIRVGMIGSGEMAKGMMNQIVHYSPGMDISVTYSRNTEKVEKVYNDLGIKDYVVTNNLQKANDAVLANKPVITSDIDMLIHLDNIDVLVEATGAIDFGADTLMKAFKNGKHVLSFNAELDSTLGPILYKKSKEMGVKYSLSDGDQPGVTMNLYRYVKSMGFEPLLCGNIKGMQDRYRTPETQKGFAESWGMNPYMATNFADGTKISFEQSCIANATGMKVAQRGMLGFESKDHVDKLIPLFDIDILKDLGGIVDYVVGAQPSPGVFIYATTDDPISKKYLKYGKLGEGPLYSFYVPFHLLFFDIASSICRLVDLNDPVIVPLDGPVVDVVATAKVELSPGDILDGIGGFKTYGLCENHDVVKSENLLHMGISHDCIVTRPVKKDQVLTYADVEIPKNRQIDQLMDEQIKHSNSRHFQ
jgi:predicted homoserine dehydrogenase-like protein